LYWEKKSVVLGHYERRRTKNRSNVLSPLKKMTSSQLRKKVLAKETSSAKKGSQGKWGEGNKKDTPLSEKPS